MPHYPLRAEAGAVLATQCLAGTREGQAVRDITRFSTKVAVHLSFPHPAGEPLQPRIRHVCAVGARIGTCWPGTAGQDCQQQQEQHFEDAHAPGCIYMWLWHRVTTKVGMELPEPVSTALANGCCDGPKAQTESPAQSIWPFFQGGEIPESSNSTSDMHITLRARHVSIYGHLST
jgi:hypothetical protein